MCGRGATKNRVGQLCGGGYFGLLGRPSNVGGTSAQLDADFDRGDLDLMHAKRRSEEQRGISLYREPLVWTGLRDSAIRAEQKGLPGYLPIAQHNRSAALDSVKRNGIAWQSACGLPERGGS